MRSVVAFSLSFVLAAIIGVMMLRHARHPARSALRSQPISKPLAPSLDFFPALPSFIVPPLDDLPKQYNEAWQLLKSGRYRAAERSYLQILIRNPNDQKAMQGLVTLQRFLADQDHEKLKGQAQRYRLAADGGLADEHYARREMELLAKASESASNEIATERALSVTALSRISPSDLAAPAAAPSAARRPLGNAIAAVTNRVSKLASSVRLLQGTRDPGAGPRPRSLPSRGDTRRLQRGWTAPGRSWSDAGSPEPGTSIGNLVYPVSQQAQDLTTQSSPSGTAKGDDLEPARTAPSDPPGQKSNSGGVNLNGPADKTSGSQREVPKKGSSGSGGNAGSGESGSGGGGASAGGGKSGGADAGGGRGGGGGQGGKDAKGGKDGNAKDNGDKGDKERDKGGGSGKDGKKD